MEEDESAEDRDCDHELVGPYRLFSCEELDWVCREAIETTSEKLFTPINLSPKYQLLITIVSFGCC